MFKKKILSAFLGASILFSGASLSLASEKVINNEETVFVNEESESFKDRIQQLKNNDSTKNILTNQKLSQEDIETEKFIIEALDKVYFSKESLNKEEKFELFSEYVRNIIRGYNNAAEAIWDYSINNDDFNIDLSYYSKSSITPLMAAGISDLEGGNVEYAILLLERGANPNQTTKKNNISTISLTAVKDNYKTLTALILAGANPLKKDDMGLTAYDYAKKHDSEKSTLIILNIIESFINN